MCCLAKFSFFEFYHFLTRLFKYNIDILPFLSPHLHRYTDSNFMAQLKGHFLPCAFLDPLTFFPVKPSFNCCGISYVSHGYLICFLSYISYYTICSLRARLIIFESSKKWANFWHSRKSVDFVKKGWIKQMNEHGIWTYGMSVFHFRKFQPE